MENKNNQSTDISDNDQLTSESRFMNLNIVESTTISASIPIKNKTDSAYSSFISQTNAFFLTSSPVVNHPNTNNNKVDSPGTSYSSRNSALINDEELDEMYTNYNNQFHPIEKLKESLFYLHRDTDHVTDILPLRHSVRNSPWLVRPESAPLHEEDEDSEKEAVEYSCSVPQEPISMTGLPELVQSTLQRNGFRAPIFLDSEQRNEHIASKLKEIADKLNTSSKVRMRYHSTSSEGTKPPTRRHSHSSFADIVPCGCGSVLDLILSLYNVYKEHSNAVHTSTVANSKSMANISPLRQRINSRSRSYTQ